MKIQQLRIWLALTTGVALLGCLIDLGSETSLFDAHAQSDKKTVKLAKTIRPQLKLTNLKVAQQDIKFGESFDAEADWVKNLSFKLENISDKKILYIRVNVNFPETRLTGYMMSYQVSFGQRPDSKLKQINPPMLLKPGEILEVSLDKEKDRIYNFVGERQPIELIREVELEMGFILFEDRTAWSVGSFMRQDPDNPDRYIPIENETQH